MQVKALSLLSHLKRLQRRLHEALSLSCQAYLLSQQSGNLYSQVTILLRQCECHYDLGRNFLQASSAVQEALVLLDALDMGSSGAVRGTLLNYQAEISREKTEYAVARKAHQAIIGDFDLATLYASTHIAFEAFHVALALLNIAEIDIESGNVDHCGYDVESRLATLRTLPENRYFFPPLSWLCDSTNGSLYLYRKQYDLAQNMYQRCLALTRTEFGSTSSKEMLIYLHRGLARTVLANGTHSDVALRYATIYLLEARDAKVWSDTHRALRCLGDVFLVDGDEQTAEMLLNIALEGFTFSDIHQGKYIGFLHSEAR